MSGLYMTDSELYEIRSKGKGIEGFIATANALARYMGECQYRNEYTIAYQNVQITLDELSRTPRDFGYDYRDIVNATPLEQSDVDKLLLPLTELCRSLAKWASQEAPYSYDITNEPIANAIQLISDNICSAGRKFDEGKVEQLFFSAGNRENTYEYCGDFFYELAKASPEYDELLDPTLMTKRSKEKALAEFQKKLEPLKRQFQFQSRDPFVIITEGLQDRTKTLKDGYVNRSDVECHCSFLNGAATALALQTVVGYDEYAEEEPTDEDEYEFSADGNIPAYNYVFAEIPERDAQQKLRTAILDYLMAGAALAQKDKSSSYKRWTAAYIAYTKGFYKDCVEHIKEALPQLYADIVVKHYCNNGRLTEFAPRPLHIDDSEFNTICHLAETYVTNTETLHRAVLLNNVDTSSEESLERGERLLMPHMQPVIGIFQPAFIKSVERAGKLLSKSVGGHSPLSHTLNKIDSLWRAFFKKLHTMACDQNEHAIINRSHSAMLELLNLYQFKITGTPKDTIPANVLNDECEKFLTTLPDLSAFVTQLGSRVFDQQVETHKPLTKTDVQEAFQKALGSTPIEIKDATVRKIRGAFDDMATSVKEVADNTRHPAQEREDILALVRDVYNAKIKGVTSYAKAAHFVRNGITEAHEEFYQRAVWARSFAKTHAKKKAGGLDEYWRSIGQDAKPSAAKQRAKQKAKRRNGAPGIAPILNRGADCL